MKSFLAQKAWNNAPLMDRYLFYLLIAMCGDCSMAYAGIVSMHAKAARLAFSNICAG
jgi:hypothetical protein